MVQTHASATRPSEFTVKQNMPSRKHEDVQAQRLHSAQITIISLSGGSFGNASRIVLQDDHGIQGETMCNISPARFDNEYGLKRIYQQQQQTRDSPMFVRQENTAICLCEAYTRENRQVSLEHKIQ